MRITTEHKEIWFDVYILNQHQGDPHEEFSYRMNLPRHEAKEICYIILWSSSFISGTMKSIKENLDRTQSNI